MNALHALLILFPYILLSSTIIRYGVEGYHHHERPAEGHFGGGIGPEFGPGFGGGFGFGGGLGDYRVDYEKQSQNDEHIYGTGLESDENGTPDKKTIYEGFNRGEFGADTEYEDYGEFVGKSGTKGKDGVDGEGSEIRRGEIVGGGASLAKDTKVDAENGTTKASVANSEGASDEYEDFSGGSAFEQEDGKGSQSFEIGEKGEFVGGADIDRSSQTEKASGPQKDSVENSESGSKLKDFSAGSAFGQESGNGSQLFESGGRGEMIGGADTDRGSQIGQASGSESGSVANSRSASDEYEDFRGSAFGQQSGNGGQSFESGKGELVGSADTERGSKTRKAISVDGGSSIGLDRGMGGETGLELKTERGDETGEDSAATDGTGGTGYRVRE